jgi:hypothetical protein
MAMSLDGYIVGKDGDTAWLNNAMSLHEDYGFAEFMSKIGAYILGAVIWMVDPTSRLRRSWAVCVTLL